MIAFAALVVALSSSWAVSAAWRRHKGPLSKWVLLGFDVLCVLWAFAFTVALVHLASDVMPARKHGTFDANALASGGIVVLVATLLPWRRRPLVVGVLLTLSSIIAIGDVFYMRYFGGVLPLSAAGSAALAFDVRDSIASLVQPGDARMLLPVFGALLLVCWGFARTRMEPSLGVVSWVMNGVLLAGGVAGAVYAARDVTTFLGSKWAIEVLNREDNVWNAGIGGAHLREIALLVKTQFEKRPLDESDKGAIRAALVERARVEDQSAADAFGIARGKSLLVVQVEALESWPIGVQVGGKPLTPFLDRLRGETLYYPNTFDQVGSSSTSDCEYLLLNSQHPLTSGAVAFLRADNHFVTLATTLRDRGYQTLSMHAYRRGMWNRAVLHPRYGFDRSLFADELPQGPLIGWGLADTIFFERAVEEMQALHKPFFAYAITISSHHPYSYIPEKQRRVSLGELEGTMVGGYLHSIAYADDALAALFRALEQAGLLEDLVVVVFGDHDAHVELSAKQRNLLAGALALAPEVARRIGAGRFTGERVPLFVRLPKALALAPQHSDDVGGQIDIAPTVLHLLGVERPLPFFGRARLPNDAQGFAAKLDGSAVGQGLLWDASRKVCERVDDGRVVPAGACSELARRAQTELRLSWQVTDHDLAHEMQAASASTAP